MVVAFDLLSVLVVVVFAAGLVLVLLVVCLLLVVLLVCALTPSEMAAVINNMVTSLIAFIFYVLG